MTPLLVALGAAVGAPLRYLVDRAVRVRSGSAFPWGTLLVNVAGSLLFGALFGASLAGWIGVLLGTGFCGALTTYSTFGYETLRLAEDGARVHAVFNVVLSVTAALGAAYCGMALADAL